MGGEEEEMGSETGLEIDQTALFRSIGFVETFKVHSGVSSMSRVRMSPSGVDSLTGPRVERAVSGGGGAAAIRGSAQQAMRREVEAWTSRSIRVITSAASLPKASLAIGQSPSDRISLRPHGPTNVNSPHFEHVCGRSDSPISFFLSLTSGR